MENENITLVAEFLAEARAMLDEAELKLLDLEKTTAGAARPDVEVVNSVFRVFHSIKSVAGFLRFGNIMTVTHQAETLLDSLRKGKTGYEPRHTETLCGTCDFLRNLLDRIDNAGSDAGAEPEAEQAAKKIAESMVSTPAVRDAAAPVLEKTSDGTAGRSFAGQCLELAGAIGRAAAASVAGAAGPQAAAEEILGIAQKIRRASETAGFQDIGRIAGKIENWACAMRSGVIAADRANMAMITAAIELVSDAAAGIAAGGSGLINNIEAVLKAMGELAPIPAGAETPAGEALPVPDAVRELHAEEHRYIRVDATKLEQLNNLIGELAIATAMVTKNKDLTGLRHYDFERAWRQLNQISADIRDVSASLSATPIGPSFRKMTRLVHDLSAKLEKKVEIRFSGEETELDKNAAELLADPLMHLVRNALDHGIETPAQRLAAGKPETGAITLDARHETGEVRITVADDGRGLDRAKILEKAVERGMIKDNGAWMSDCSVYELVFTPGFTTLADATEVSGRGVGMDVVKKNVEKLRGKVEIESEPGRGVKIILRIPLASAVVLGMLCRVGRDRYAIPMRAIHESFRPSQYDLFEAEGGNEAFRHRGEKIRLLRLSNLFKAKGAVKKPHQGIIVVVEAGGKKAGLLVDELLGQSEMTFKRLSDAFGAIPYADGATVLSDGRVAFILDVRAIVQSE